MRIVFAYTVIQNAGWRCNGELRLSRFKTPAALIHWRIKTPPVLIFRGDKTPSVN